MIKRLIIRNFKGIEKADIPFHKGKNIIVGNNGAGKSTIVEALSLALGYGLNQFEIEPYIFNINAIKQFKTEKNLPEILIEVYFDGENDGISGTNNTCHILSQGLSLRISFDEESYSELFAKEKADCSQIPCEYYKKEWFWFSGLPVKQFLIPYHIQIVDSSSHYFNASSNQYIINLLRNNLGEDDFFKIKKSLRKLSQTFDDLADIKAVNETLSTKQSDLKVSLDITTRMIYRDIIYPLKEDIPVDQIGAGDLCILKTMLSLDKSYADEKENIIIIEEPESHLSHTKMYELLNKIEIHSSNSKTQLIITTHNNFVANKLDLNNLILINNENYTIKTKVITPGDKELSAFFTKIANYPTLRLILCKKALLVEGPTDEMIVTYYYQRTFRKHPFDDGIELITVGGVAFKQFAKLANCFDKKIAIMTDNDGLEIKDLLLNRGIEEDETIKVFTDTNSDNKTIEPSFVCVNVDKLQKLSDAIRGRKKENDTKNALVTYMSNNKTDWAYRILNKIDDNDFNVPDYIKQAIEWLLN